MRKLIPIIIGCLFLFQPANDSESQVRLRSRKQSDTLKSNSVLKDKLDVKADSVLKKIEEIKQTVEDKPPVIKWRTKWKTKTIYKIDTVFQCPPSDEDNYKDDNIDTVYKTIYVPLIKHDTVYKRKRFLRIF